MKTTEKKKTIVGKILEVRTSGDGDYDWSPNCWESDYVLIITDKAKYAFTGDYCVENDSYYMKQVDIPDNYAQKYPFILHRYSSSEISVKSEEYDSERNLTDLMLYYEDVLLWISGNSMEFILCSVHEMGCAEESEYLPWDEYERCIRLEFDKVTQ